MKILFDQPGQTCNRLWSYFYSVQESIEKKEKLYILFFDKNIKYFPHLLDDSKYVIFPFYLESFINIFGYNRYNRILRHVFYNRYSEKIYEIINKFGIECRKGWEYRSLTYNKQNAKNIKGLFMPDNEIVSYVDNWFLEKRKNYDYIIGVHIRLGDYKTWENGNYYYSLDVYFKYMHTIISIFENKKILFFISSNERINYVDNLVEFIQFENKNDIFDLYGLSKCDYIFGPLSTFSRWASFIGNVPLHFIENTTGKVELSDFSPIEDFYHFQSSKEIPNLTDK